jgi:(S)-ureidoglycine aminohydrolase
LNPLGHSRTTVRRTHALIAPDSHVVTPLPGWENTRGVVHVSPAMGAGFTQYTALLDRGATAGPADEGVERFIYMLDGTATLDTGNGKMSMREGSFAFLPAGHRSTRLVAAGTGKALILEKRFVAEDGVEAPKVVSGHESEIAAAPFMGDPDAQLKLLLPDTPAFDMAINIFIYNPGAMLPQVECHVMEHGLLMLQGMGVYRLDDRWYPVTAGDVIWMAPYCPQWFIAGGKSPSRYIYYKNANRSPLRGNDP